MLCIAAHENYNSPISLAFVIKIWIRGRLSEARYVVIPVGSHAVYYAKATAGLPAVWMTTFVLG